MSQIREVEVAYNDAAVEYDSRILKSRWMGYTVLRQALVDFPQRPRTMLDLGAGTGNTIGIVRESANPEQIVAIDISEGMLDKLRQKYPDDPRIVVTRKAIETYLGEEKGDQFDLVTAMGVTPYIRDKEKVIGGIASRLSTSGVAMFTYDPLIVGHPLQSEKEEVSKLNGMTCYRVTVGEMEAMTRESGLEVMQNGLYLSRPGDESNYVGGFIVAKKPEDN